MRERKREKNSALSFPSLVQRRVTEEGKKKRLTREKQRQTARPKTTFKSIRENVEAEEEKNKKKTRKKNKQEIIIRIGVKI